VTIEGSLQMSIPIVKAFLTRNYRSRQNWPKICVLGKWGRSV